jgi:hypothetical protein
MDEGSAETPKRIDAPEGGVVSGPRYCHPAVGKMPIPAVEQPQTSGIE